MVITMIINVFVFIWKGYMCTSLEHNVFKSLNVSMGTLCGLNFATESESDRKNHIDSLIFACMSLSI